MGSIFGKIPNESIIEDRDKQDEINIPLEDLAKLNGITLPPKSKRELQALGIN